MNEWKKAVEMLRDFVRARAQQRPLRKDARRLERRLNETAANKKDKKLAVFLQK